MPAPTAPLLTSTTCRFSSISRTSLLGDRRDAIVVERAVFVGQHARADFDDDGLRACGNFLANGIEHGEVGAKSASVWRRRRLMAEPIARSQHPVAHAGCQHPNFQTPTTRSFTVRR